MKKWESKLSVKRISTSPYFTQDFNQMEKEALAPFVDYTSLESQETNEAADILITNTHTNFELFSPEQLQKLKLIIHPNSGFDNIPVDFVRTTKAPIVIGNAIRAHAVSEYILSALFQHFSPIAHHASWDKSRKWPRRLLSDLKITLIGYGHIGKILSRTLSPLVKELMIYDPFENFTQLDAKQSDVVIVASSLNSKNKHMIDKTFLNTIKDNAFIINAARGELIKTADLVNFLMANEEAFAVLDVFESEPHDFSPFKTLKNIKHTSHIAGVYKNIDIQTVNFEVSVVKDFLELTEFDFKNKYQKAILQNRFRPDIGLL